ncbi:hypothetical protein [Halomonas sp. WWR20]
MVHFPGRGSDRLRVMAIASQATGFTLIILLETWLGDAARVWQGVTLAVMLIIALWLALVRHYRRNKMRKAAHERARKAR